MRVLRDFKATATRPLVLYGRRGEWRFDGSATVYPKDARMELRPTVTKTASGTTVTWRVKVTGSDGTILRAGAIKSFRLRGVTTKTLFQVASRTSSYDQYRGTLRVGLKSTEPLASATNERSLEGYLQGVVPVRDAVDLAGGGAEGAIDRRALLRGPPTATGRVVLRRG